MPPNSSRQVNCEIKKVAGKGLGVFATQKIHSGDLVFSEKPLFKLTKIYDNIHEKINDIESQLGLLTPKDRQLFLSLSDCHRPQSPTPLTIYQTNALPLGEYISKRITKLRFSKLKQGFLH